MTTAMKWERAKLPREDPLCATIEPGAIPFGKAIWNNFARHHCVRLAAALAYYLVLSLAPIVLVVIGVAGLVWGEKAASGQVIETMRAFMGQAGAEVVQSI